ncbi:MAG: arylsulfatase [Rhodothermaceae bacterium]|nr:arylsulfatase [Rhodothermaceae bacterium]MXZ57359.1 arylsulfatase [Rhodothermaceae bacterium]MYB90602.1 arylsulfatase [Rhodothermaceae bacterium]MYD68350.1 arylsulfatase [Rhodothermaceae bacterium]MYG44339.1 arylsulfatase [Rhodothermaceae bacterium]
MTKFAGLIFLNLAILLAGCVSPDPAPRPNVILVITDDQGYGDIGAHGNTAIHTPVLDRLHNESVRLTDFHVDPTCSPTRAALLTGRYSTRTGVWHTIMGRSLMAPEEVTLAELFAEVGYRTGMVGKWHLGDNYPLRPQDQGFQEAFYHPAGGVGQGPDYFGNDYFDDTYVRNGVLEETTGYVTDVWFDDALRFIGEHQHEPFFLYLATNAPHGPYFVEETYAAPYREAGFGDIMARFSGMITNIDDNMGRLLAELDSLGLSENTIFIFMTDNGSAEGWANWREEEGSWEGFNAGMRQGKGSEYDGGHRVPFFLRWPAAGYTGSKEVDALTAHIDVLPTLAELCDLPLPADLDGMSLVPVLNGSEPDARTLFVHSQRVPYPIKWRKSAVMTERWRLVNQNELYDIQNDPEQMTNLVDQFPDVAQELRTAYEGWWDHLEPTFDRYVRIGLGADAENPLTLNPHDWHVTNQSESVWNHRQVQNGMIGNGYWAVDVLQPGNYTFELRRWPNYMDEPMERIAARIRVGDQQKRIPLTPEQNSATFEFVLNAGPTTVQTWLIQPDGEEHGAYFVYVRRE